MDKARTRVKVAALTASTALLLAACGGSDDGDSGTAGAEGMPGGALHLLTQLEQFDHLDPQRAYVGENLAFASAFLQRTLVQFAQSADDEVAGTLVPDLATDTGTPSEGGRVWSFTLRDGALFEDGTPITCEEVKYGVSRTFATDIIVDGPQYAVSMLDIPTKDDGTSAYKGPYRKTGQDLYDKAVTCSEDGMTITFHLNRPAGDFNYTTALLAFSPVPQAADTGEKYDARPLSSGPYKIEDFTVGKSLTLVRNDMWSPDTDPYRKAYPDTVDVTFALSNSVITQRLMTDSGEDQTALSMDSQIDPAQLAAIFNDARFEGRRFDGYDVYVRYWAINTKRVPELKHRQAIEVAFPRADVRTISGGNFAGDLADGVIKPSLTEDYEPSGMWTDMYGQAIPDNGDPEYAKKLIEESGKPMPEITLDYQKTEVNDKIASAVVAGLEKAGMTVKPNPIDPGGFYPIVMNPKKAGSLIRAGWGSDWPNASTIIPELFTPVGGFNLSLYDNPEFNQKVAEALAIEDRAEQGKAWAELNKVAMQQALLVPTRFQKQQRIIGSKVGGAYLWAPYGSWGYGDLSIKQ